MGWTFQILVWKSRFLWFLLDLPMFSAPRAEKHWFYQCFCKGTFTKHWQNQCFSALGAENIGKTNKNNNKKKHDFQTMGWRFQILVWKSWFLWFLLALPMFSAPRAEKTLVLPMFCEGTLAKTLVKPMFFSPRSRKHWQGQ